VGRAGTPAQSASERGPRYSRSRAPHYGRGVYRRLAARPKPTELHDSTAAVDDRSLTYSARCDGARGSRSVSHRGSDTRRLGGNRSARHRSRLAQAVAGPACAVAGGGPHLADVAAHRAYFAHGGLFLLGIAFAFVLSDPASYLGQRPGGRHALGIALAYLITFVIVMGVLVLLAAPIVRQLGDLNVSLPTGCTRSCNRVWRGSWAPICAAS